ncbi:Apelin receptor B [Aphelenchoides fujianensis]|nr:Apelin receptor B [Aphelenchoides fujianensis]
MWSNYALVGIACVAGLTVNRRPRGRAGALSPSARLRCYIGMLAAVDAIVIFSLLVRLIYTVLPEATTDDLTCQATFAVDKIAKFIALSILSCISFERFISIRKPFNSHLRKRFVQLTPLFALGGIAVVFSAVFFGRPRTPGIARWKWSDSPFFVLSIARWTLAVAFMLQLIVVTCNYASIVRHVRHKYWQRRTRAIIATRSRQPLINEPRYLKEMTVVIVRIAVFHLICYFPLCALQLVPSLAGPQQAASLRLFDETQTSALGWVNFVANYLTICGPSFGRRPNGRKRSTMSQSSPPSNLHRSLRKHVGQSLRFFYSINSYRSHGGSFDSATQTGTRQGSIESGTSGAPVARSVSNACGVTSSEGLFGMRNGRAHTFCSPRSSNGMPGMKNVTSTRPVLAALFGPKNTTLKCPPERFV